MKKFFRSLARNGTASLTGAKIGGGIGAAATTALAIAAPAVSVEGFFLANAVIGGGIAAIGAGIGKLNQLITESDWHYSCDYSLEENSCTLNGYKLVGKRGDLKKIIRTQRHIGRIAKKHQTESVLPEAAQKSILNHVRDIQPLLEKCRVYGGSYRDTQEKKFDFKRDFYNEHGRKETQIIVSVELISKEEAQQKMQPIMLASLESQRLQAEFDAEAKRSAKQDNNAPKPPGFSL